MNQSNDKPMHTLDGGNGIKLLSPVSAEEYEALPEEGKAVARREIRRLNRKTLDKEQRKIPAYAVELQKVYKFAYAWQTQEVDKFVRSVFPNLTGKTVEQCHDWLTRNRIYGQFIDYRKLQIGGQKLLYGIVCWEPGMLIQRCLELNIELSVDPQTGKAGFKAEAKEIEWPCHIAPRRPA